MCVCVYPVPYVCASVCVFVCAGVRYLLTGSERWLLDEARSIPSARANCTDLLPRTYACARTRGIQMLRGSASLHFCFWLDRHCVIAFSPPPLLRNPPLGT